jgi:hypothetical protein
MATLDRVAALCLSLAKCLNIFRVLLYNYWRYLKKTIEKVENMEKLWNQRKGYILLYDTINKYKSIR